MGKEKNNIRDNGGVKYRRRRWQQQQQQQQHQQDAVGRGGEGGRRRNSAGDGNGNGNGSSFYFFIPELSTQLLHKNEEEIVYFINNITIISLPLLVRHRYVRLGAKQDRLIFGGQ
mmetsp:Transcript_49039/g.49823  ORF Transcript_49039/g.49823 Transcript_49039/m.49823 type:complete len:115 (+) Transcript_49039:137-481(+)